MDDTVAPRNAGLKPREIARRVLAWWDVHRRDLPWRAKAGETPDPYRVWLSEILLQQTTATAAAPYFQEFVARWPRVEALAAASLDEVMAAFSGLGYYSRARNLHACARQVALRGGRFPQSEAELRALPGVGAYTAAAVAAIAYDAKAAPVDGNIARILARLYALEAAVAQARRAIGDAAAALTPANRPGDFAQALMDIGALICRPRNPDCPSCPLRAACAAARTDAPDAYPRRGNVKPRPVRVGAAFFARREDGAILARRRPPKGLLGGDARIAGRAVGGGGARRRRLGSGALRGVVAATAGRSRAGLHPFHAAADPLRRRSRLGAREAQGSIWIDPAKADSAGFSSLMLKAVAHARRCADAQVVNTRSYGPSRKAPS